MGPNITAFFDYVTNTISYVVRDPNGSACAIIDSVLDFDFASGRTDTQSADNLINFVTENKLDVQSFWKVMCMPTIFQQPLTFK